MSKSSNMVYKLLVVGVIVLFVCVGIQPVIAVDVSTSISASEDKCNENDTSIGLGFIVCIVYGVWDPGFPFGLIFEPLVPVVCEDLNTGSKRVGITRLLGFHIFKFLPIGHDYNIKILIEQKWREQTVPDLKLINIVEFNLG